MSSKHARRAEPPGSRSQVISALVVGKN